MANVQHSALTDPELHEPKDISTASSGEVYVADGSASGAWGLAETIEATKDVTGTDGYVKLPGGVILQWGFKTLAANTAVLVSFSTSFPNALLSVQATIQENNNQDRYPAKIGYTDASQFGLYNTNGISQNYYWIAIGY